MNRRHRLDRDDGAAPETAREVHATDRDTFTGLYDHNEQPLHRRPEPFGFHPRWNVTKNTKSKRSR